LGVGQVGAQVVLVEDLHQLARLAVVGRDQAGHFLQAHLQGGGVAAVSGDDP
jgi:hypothetical protein